MRRFVIFFLFFSSLGGSAFAADQTGVVGLPAPERALEQKPLLWTVGLGIGSNYGSGVNPSLYSSQGLGEIYASLSMRPWSLLFEVQRGEAGSSIGNYAVNNVSYDSILWGRYEPLRNYRFRPYVGLGLGWDLHEIDTTFGSARDHRWGSGGGILGLTSGVTTLLYKHWNMEGEIRLTKEELIPDPVIGFVFRTGYSFQ